MSIEPMSVPYFKMHGTGNRILVVDQRHHKQAPPPPEKLREFGDPDTGPGFDQLMWVGPASDASADASYRVFNNDGSEVEQCGNGARCVAWVLARSGNNSAELRLESPAGLIETKLIGPDRVAVNMGRPEFEPSRVPFEADEAALQYAFEIDGRQMPVAVLSMGNPHCVLEVADVEAAEVALLGPLIETDSRFPRRTNVGFMAVRDRDEIDLRVHERGVGETQACGTGACAAVVSARRRDLVDEEVRVNLPGGQLVVKWRGKSDTVWLTGNAELISEGTIDL